jgi:NADPH:quinone reductase
VKAIRVREFGGPEVLRLETVPDLQAGPGQVLVRVRAAGVNPVDTYIRAGQYARTPPLPFTPGVDGAGEIEAVGAGVTGIAAGARVYFGGTESGAYASQALCAEAQVHPLPDRIDFPEGAAIGVPYATAWRALFQKARAAPGEIVLVHGASGGVGLAAVQIARAGGLQVFGTAGTTKGREMAEAQGARRVFDHTAAGYLDALLAATGGRGVDVVLEMLANRNLGRVLKALAPGGRVVVIGSRGTVEIDPRDAMSRDASILGMLLFNAPADDLAAAHAALGAGLENDTLRPVVGRRLPLEQAALAHRAVLEPGACGKIVLLP